MGVFADLADADMFEKGFYFKPGRYEVEIKKVAREKSKRKPGVSHFKVITKIISCESNDGGPAPFKPGDEVNAIYDLSKASGPSNAKMFVRRAAQQFAMNRGMGEADLKALDKEFAPNAPPETNGEHPSEKHFAACVGPDSVLIGMRIHVDAFNNADGTFTNVNWVPRAESAA